MNAIHSRYVWTSVSASGVLHVVAVVGLLSVGGSPNGWSLRAYSPPAGHSAPKLTLRMSSASSQQESSPEHAIRLDLTTTTARHSDRESSEARLVPAARIVSVAPEFVTWSPADVESFRTAEGEDLVIAVRGTKPAAARRTSVQDTRMSPYVPATANPTNSPLQRARTEARIVTQSGVRAELRVVRAESPQKPRRDTIGRSTAESAASRASERRTGVVAVPEKVFSPQPDYPAAELAAGHEGRVLLRVTVNAGGLVESAVVQRSSGFPVLDAAAEKAVRRWRFKLPDDDAYDRQSTREVAVPIRFEIQR